MSGLLFEAAMLTATEIAYRRLVNQHILQPQLKRPEEVAGWLGAIQAQDFAAAKWALGLRLLPGATDASVEQAFNCGAILRTHLLRPTWHFVTPADIRWLLALTAPRVHIANGTHYRRLGIDSGLASRSQEIFVQALQGGQQLTRDELRGVLQRAGISTGGLRMGYLLMRAELDGVICSGPRRGRQFTYALLDERVPPAPAVPREQALADLASRYFRSRGPATDQDFAKWSGLTLADARRGLQAVRSHLEYAVVDGQSYWFSPSMPVAPGSAPAAFLLSIYDEFISGYKDHHAIASEQTGSALRALGNDLTAIVVIDGQITGTWKRALRKNGVALTVHYFSPLSVVQEQAVATAARRYGEFLGLGVELA